MAVDFRKVAEIGINTFGIPVTYIKGNTSYSVTAIKDEPALFIDPNSGEMIQTIRHRINIKYNEFNKLGINPFQGDKCIVRGLNYTVQDVMSDGQGAWEIILAEGFII